MGATPGGVSLSNGAALAGGSSDHGLAALRATLYKEEYASAWGSYDPEKGRVTSKLRWRRFQEAGGTESEYSKYAESLTSTQYDRREAARDYLYEKEDSDDSDYINGAAFVQRALESPDKPLESLYDELWAEEVAAYRAKWG